MRGRRAVAMAVLVLVIGACSSGGPGPSASPATSTTADRSTTSTTTARPATLGAEAASWVLPAPRSREVAVLDRGSIVIAGGLDGAGRSSPNVWTVEPTSGRATAAAPMVQGVHDAAGGLIGSRVLVFGGGSSGVSSSVQSATGARAIVGTLPRPLADIATATVGATTYVVGGYDGVRPRAEVLATDDGATFRPIATLPRPARYPAVAVHDGHLFVIGGETGAGDSDAVYDVVLASGAVSTIGHLPGPRSHAVAVTLGGSVWLLGGRVVDQPDRAILRIDPRTGAVTAAGVLPAAVRDAAVVATGPDDAYLLGGARSAPVAEVVHLHLTR